MYVSAPPLTATLESVVSPTAHGPAASNRSSKISAPVALAATVFTGSAATVAVWAAVAAGAAVFSGAGVSAGVGVSGETAGMMSGTGVLVGRPAGSKEVGTRAVRVAATPESITAWRGAQAESKDTERIRISAIRFIVWEWGGLSSPPSGRLESLPLQTKCAHYTEKKRRIRVEMDAPP